MKIYRLLLLALIFCLFISCNKDDEDVFATESSPDWYEIKDKPGELNQLLYQIYKDYGLTIFVNDTLGVEERGLDAYGNKIVHTQLFDPGYYVWGTYKDIGNISLSHDNTSLLKAVNAIKDVYLPVCPKDMYPRSILLVDTVNTVFEYQYVMYNTECFVYSSSIRGYVVGKLNAIKQMSDIELRHWVGQIIAPKCVEWILSNYETDEIDEFYDISNDAYSYRIYETTIHYSEPEYNAEPQALGFWRWKKHIEELWVKRTISQNDDLLDFAAWVFAYWNNQDEFYEKYKDYEPLTQKFTLYCEWFKAFCEAKNLKLEK
ncbi:MAG: hypothetical protein ACLTSL_09550 [Odoribacter splanchnicus]